MATEAETVVGAAFGSLRVSMHYFFAGLLLAYGLAKRLVSPVAAVVATLAIWFGSSLPVYAYFIPFHVHALASFDISQQAILL